MERKFSGISIVIYLFLGFSFWQVQCKCSYATGQHPLQNLKPIQSNQYRNGTDSLAKQVTIKRTKHGVPHIEAQNMQAAGFALGYAQMEDYGERVPNELIRARGEWAKYHDVKTNKLDNALDSDAANRRDYARAVATWYFLDADTRHMEKGFAAGVNYYIELHPDEFDSWVRPLFTGYDVHARDIGSPSRSSIRRFLSALKHRQSREDKKPTDISLSAKHATIWARLAANWKEPNPDVGSNAWAFAPSRTTSGHAILLRNPHLSWDAGYYEAHVKVPEKLNFYGDFRIGGPFGTVGGFNEHLGWTTTNNYPDLDEIYAFKADPKQPDHYLLDGVSVPIHRKTITVEFKNGDGIGRARREFLSTPYGSVVRRGNGKIYVIHAAGDREFREGEQFMRMMEAQDLAEWKQAMRMRAKISSNFTYADDDGNIFYVWNATIPILPNNKTGHDTLAIAVSKSDQIWKKIMPWDSLPHLKNPKGGYLHNENDPFYYTNLNEVFSRRGFPANFPKPSFGLRSQQSYKLIHNENQKFSLKDIVKLKFTTVMLLADRVKDDLVAAVSKAKPTGEVAKALKLIKQWDNTVARNSSGGVLFRTWWYRYVHTSDTTKVTPSPESVGFHATPQELFGKVWSSKHPAVTPSGLADPVRAVKAFKWAIEKDKKEYGSWNVTWGQIHRAIIGDIDVPIGGCSGILGCFRVLRYTKAKDKQNRQILRARGGDGWVLAVEFSNPPRAYSVLAYGESNKKESSYFNDQLQMFANNKMKPVAFIEKNIRKQLTQEYHPGEEKGK